MSVIVQFAMFPTDKGASVSLYVSRILGMIRREGFIHQLTPMATIVETETLGEALEMINKAYRLLEPDCGRVYLSANFDIKKSPMGRMEQKVKSVEEKIKNSGVV
ncbi:MAG TPA: hypothetical protein DCR43_00285 [Bacteroidales bacterium]|nr:MAG: hypothetical protein A2X11_07710 [Bacteroidetes bacterium GWE2_42_24]OFY26478.1 MAG: hypothetical protein A2X09_02245 [Bacteroidetes bacterium GWF2_43_11]PKP23846.1 MAG: hypothetical protein CVU06_06175 [Bacteroidetes bacterium HGW-Bacteroidetes-22]HAQ64289.1 hypothetical protein [Bacteroidales bacterium]HBZ67713.1 hypothetical protein [Bacteroidales bacterium]